MTIMTMTKRTVNWRWRLLASLGAHGSGKTPAGNTGSTLNNFSAGHVLYFHKKLSRFNALMLTTLQKSGNPPESKRSWQGGRS